MKLKFGGGPGMEFNNMNEFQINFEQQQFQIMEIVLSEKNIKHFRNTIEDAKALYQEIQEEKDNILEVVLDWNIPKKIILMNRCFSSCFFRLKKKF